MPLCPHHFQRHFKRRVTLSQCCLYLMAYWIKLLHGSAFVCGGAMVFCFNFNPVLLLYYDLIFLLIFITYPTIPKLSTSLKQPFCFAMILWTNKSLAGQFLPVVSHGLPSSGCSAVWPSKVVHIHGCQWCSLLAGSSSGLPSRMPMRGLSSMAGSGVLDHLHSGWFLPNSFPGEPG